MTNRTRQHNKRDTHRIFGNGTPYFPCTDSLHTAVVPQLTHRLDMRIRRIARMTAGIVTHAGENSGHITNNEEGRFDEIII
ncbi:hypothetical protein [Musicola keenii]|uniref:hypothetical protein n=1 Tax=Musicola keenii TaxID=2884250 RepID=UPI001784B641|nr:hypothetical protein [Musicola keenii]